MSRRVIECFGQWTSSRSLELLGFTPTEVGALLSITMNVVASGLTHKSFFDFAIYSQHG